MRMPRLTWPSNVFVNWCETNDVTDDCVARKRERESVQRRWLLLGLLSFNSGILQATQFRMLGHPMLCGVFHLAYQTNTQGRGAYRLCILFVMHMIMAVP